MDGQALASAICIGVGGSVGREGPIVQIGSSLASSIGQWVKMPESRLRILVACGAGGAIAATFNAPITGVFFGVEIILREFSIDALFTVMLSAMIADATAIPFLGDGTIYTTKLLRRGTDIDRATPWRALQDLKVADAMQPFRPPFLVKRGANGASHAAGAAPASLPGPVTSERDPQAIFATESLAQTLRQLEVYGRDGLPVLSDDGQQIAGWVTNASWPAATCPRPENPALRARASR